MTRYELSKILAEFFRDGFAEDAAGVADWLAQGGVDADEFVTELNKQFPQDE